ncbi:MAG: penicillin-binding transpeptidase domain-containing protein [Smithellaceae bacterium]|nr:penicillin-binding transpeptidase domain-containing protein [Smithellaceae bacterium]
MTGDAKKWLRFRIVTLLLFFLVLDVALTSRALQLQVFSGKTLRTLAQRQHLRTVELEPERGVIYDRNGEKLAISVMADSVCADPSKIPNQSETADVVAPILGLDRETILKKFSRGRNFCWLARRIAPDQAQSIENLGMEGLFIIQEPKRYYPNGELAGNILGFAGTDSSGLEGLEMKYNSYLRGAPQKLVWARDAKGRRLYPHIDEAATQEGTNNYHLILTIDSRIQYLAEQQLKQAVEEKGAKGGFAVVMDPKTGEILALANEPSFDPNNLTQLIPGAGKNKAITDCFDPGSTFKPFLVAAALNEGAVKETDRFFCENGNYVVGDRVIHEAQHKGHGVLTVHDILKYSSNIGSVKIGERLGKERFYHYITSFGFGSKTGIDLPGEVSGLLRPVQNWSRIDAATIAFGQGISVTSIQLVTALSAIANQGVLMKPFIVRGFVDKRGNTLKMYSPTVVRRVVTPETAKRLTAILTDVVGEEGGTGKNARIDNMAVAGKTGTSQKFDFARNVYSSERVRTSFMGFFPAQNPQVVMLITLDEPQRDRWGGMAAAPVFKKIGEQILTCVKTNIRENPAPLIDVRPNNAGPLKLVSLSTDNGIADAESEALLIPDFRGLTIRDAIKRSQKRGIELRVVGSGWAVSQDTAPGLPVREHKICTVYFSNG